MDDLVAQTSKRSLPDLVRFVLEHLHNLRLKSPANFQYEVYAQAWRSLCAAANQLIDNIENLKLDGHGERETGDEASTELFGKLSVPKAKEFLQRVLRELAHLGTKWHMSSASAGIDTQRFDADQIPLLEELHATVEDIKFEDVTTEVVKKEVVEPSPQDLVFPSTERKSFPSYPQTQYLTDRIKSFQLVQNSYNASAGRLQHSSSRPVLLAHHATTTRRRRDQQRRLQSWPITSTPAVRRRRTIPELCILHPL